MARVWSKSSLCYYKFIAPLNPERHIQDSKLQDKSRPIFEEAEHWEFCAFGRAWLFLVDSPLLFLAGLKGQFWLA